MIGSSSCSQCSRGEFANQGAVICRPESTALRAAETTATGRADKPTTSLAAALPASTESAQRNETPPQRPTAAQLLATGILAATPALPASRSNATQTLVALPTPLGSPSDGAAEAERRTPQVTASVAETTTVIEETGTASVAATTTVTQETVTGERTTPFGATKTSERSTQSIQCPLRNFFTCYGAAQCTYYVCDDVSTCPSGTYCDPAVSSDTGHVLYDQGSVISCPAGYFSENGSISLCSGGYYCPEGTAAELPCPAGFACPVGSPAPKVCLAGTFCSAPGLLTGPDCPAGSFCPIGASAPTPCPSGYFCPQASGSPFPCSAGAYCPGAPATDQLPCPVGSYCPLAALAPVPCAGGATECPAEGTECPPSMPSCSLCAIQAPGNNCSAGGYCPQEGGGVRRLLCPPGSYCPGGTAAPIPCQDPRLCPYIPYIGLSVPLACTNSRPATGGGEYLANVSGLSYGEVCLFPELCAAQISCWASSAPGFLCMPDTGAYCVVDMAGLPPDLQMVLGALNARGIQLEFTLTPCAAPSSSPVPIWSPEFDLPLYEYYPIPEGMYLSPGASFPVPAGQGYYIFFDERRPCYSLADGDYGQPLYWTQASGGRYCDFGKSDETSDDCYGVPADAQAVWHTEGPFQNPGWICSFFTNNSLCNGPACIGSITWTRHPLAPAVLQASAGP